MVGRPGTILACALATLAPIACAAQPEPAPIPTSDAIAGARAYQKCYSCHALGPQQDDRDGPTLYRIVGRNIAVSDGYRYSPAMRLHARKNGRWTRDALDAFLADPQGIAPDNSMGFFGLSDPAERAALIDWLASNPEPSE